MRQHVIRFRQSTNAFSQCSDPEALQRFADSLTANDLQHCSQKWLAQLTPFFTPRQRREAGVQHRLFFFEAEYCDNSSSGAVRLWTACANDYWMPTAPSVSPISSPSSSAAKSASS